MSNQVNLNFCTSTEVIKEQAAELGATITFTGIDFLTVTMPDGIVSFWTYLPQFQVWCWTVLSSL